jgi:hypothetical protein
MLATATDGSQPDNAPLSARGPAFLLTADQSPADASAHTPAQLRGAVFDATRRYRL